MCQYETLNFKRSKGFAVITLNRPDAANGLNTAMARELVDVATTCSEDSSIKAVVLTAAGKFFCAGGDLREMSGFGDQAAQKVKALADSLHKSISLFCRMKAPLIIAVNGVAAGGGFSLAITGDLVIAAETAAFTMAYTRAGLSPDGSSSFFLPRLIGLRKAQDMAFTNRLLTAPEALDWGLINRVVADDELLNTAMELAENLANGSLSSNSMVKKLFLDTWNNDLETQMDAEALGISQCLGSADGQEGVAAFLEKRKPDFGNSG
ncbi:MAG: enoyl-CoA hydratase [Gammaproteobacteria bacterium]|nr:enoyl-CoA hydratase [Gammaproteobacteria bacterium]